MLSRHKTTVVFCSAVVLSLASVGLLFVLEIWALILLGLSIAFNLWSVIKSDREGFIQSRQLRRAHEPARRFSALQTFIIFALLMGQIGVGTYALLA